MTALFALVWAGGLVFGQTKLDLGAQSKSVNFSNAASVIPFPTGSSLPATCVQGQMFFNTSAPAGQNSYQCTATNTWTALGSGSSGASVPLAVSLNGATELAIGSNCSLHSPCEFRVGSVVYSVGAPATVDVSTGSGLTYLYVDGSGLLTVGESVTGSPAVTCTGCQVLSGITQFPASSIPLSVWNATNGTFDGTGTDSRSVLASAPVIAAGSNVAITQTAGSITISAVDASGLSGGSGGGSGGSSGGSGVTVAGTGSELQYNNFGSLGAVTGSSVAGSTVLLGGAVPAAANQSLLGLGNAIANGNGNGTLLGINAPPGYTGDIANWMLGSSSIFSVDRYGQISFNGGFMNATQLRLAANGYSTGILANYAGVPGSSSRIMILSTDPASLLQLGAGPYNSSIVVNGMGKVSLGTTAPTPSASSGGPDVLIQNAATSNGSTLVQVQAGAGQSGDLMEWVSAGGVAGASVSAQGALRNLPFGSQPGCDATARGLLWHAQGSAGVKDTVAVCAKDSADAYAWRSIF
jgi:hypothetical protein